MAATNANCFWGMIQINIKCKHSVNIMKLYKPLIRPRLEYCLQAWFQYLKKDIEVLKKVQEWSTKIVSHVHGCWDLNYKNKLTI